MCELAIYVALLKNTLEPAIYTIVNLFFKEVKSVDKLFTLILTFILIVGIKICVYLLCIS